MASGTYGEPHEVPLLAGDGDTLIGLAGAATADDITAYQYALWAILAPGVDNVNNWRLVKSPDYTIEEVIHEILPVGMLQCNCSIFGNETSREAIVIDPGDDISNITEVLARHGLTVKAIVITHAHIDHIGGAAKLKELTGAPVYMNSNDAELYAHLDTQAEWLGIQAPSRTEIDSAARDGDQLHLASTAFQILHTPGHTQGSISIWIPAENKLIAGDTLFRGSIGRTDLPGGDSRQILRSIHEKLLALPETAIVIPGHGAATTIGREKEQNPFLQGL